MAVYFVASGGSNTAPYETWAKAATSLQTALTAASTAGDVVVIQKDAVPTGDSAVGANTTWTFAANITLISATNDGAPGSYTPSAMGDTYWLGMSATSGYTITIAGAFNVYIYGITLRMEGTSSAKAMALTNTDGAVYCYESCTFWNAVPHNGCVIRLSAGSGASLNASMSYRNCIFRTGATGCCLAIGGGQYTELVGCSLHASTSASSPLFESPDTFGVCLIDGCDFSGSGATFLAGGASSGACEMRVINTKVATSTTWLGTSVPLNLSAHRVYVHNCASGDTHYNFGYYNALGSVVSVTGIYASGGAKYDGTNGVSWQIDTSSAATYGIPFVTPWVDLYHSGTSAITPSLEILRDGSATAYDNDEVWAEFSYQGTASSTKATIVDDRMALSGTPAAQTTGALGAGDWTGEGGTAWFGKLNTTSTITPAEIGMLRARVCVGLASSTVFVDPYIRVA